MYAIAFFGFISDPRCDSALVACLWCAIYNEPFGLDSPELPYPQLGNFILPLRYRSGRDFE